MHILIIHQAFASLAEPGGTRHDEFAHYLVTQGHQVTIIASPVSYLTGKSLNNSVDPVQNDPGQPGLRVLRAYAYPALHQGFMNRVISFVSFMLSSFWTGLKVRQVDLVWGTSPPIFQAITAWMIARIRKAPFLFEVRDLWPAFAIGMGILRNPVLIKASLWLERFLYSHADRVLVNSPGFIDHVSKWGAKKIDLIPNGADPAMFQIRATGRTYRNMYDLEGKYLVVYAGAHGPSNDLETVLEAASLLKDYQNIKFVLVGDGKCKPALVDLANDLNLENVIFIPPLPKNQIAAFLAESDVGLAILKPIDLYKTTYPNKVFDYMAAGLPVVLAIDGVIRDVIESNSAGIAVKPGCSGELAEAVLKLYKQPVLSAEMGKAGRSAIENQFNRPILAARLVTIMEEMVNHNARENSDR